MKDAKEGRSIGKSQRPKLLWAALGLMILLVTLTGCDFDRMAAEREMSAGMAAYGLGDNPTAIAHMERALLEDPTFAHAAYTMGQIHQMRTNNLEEAARAYRRAVDVEPTNTRYLYRLGTVLAEQGDHDGAIRQFQTAVDHDPEYARAWFMMGLSYDAAGEFSEAVAAFTRAIETNPRLRMTAEDPGGEHYHALGDLYLRFRINDHAARVYENGVRNNPNSPRLHHGQGVALMQLERFDQAIESFRATLELDEAHGSAQFNLAVALHSSGDTDAAIEQLQYVTSRPAGLSQAQLRAVQQLYIDLTAEDEEDE